MKAIRMEAVIDTTATDYRLLIGGDEENVVIVLTGPDAGIKTDGSKTYLVKDATSPTPVIIVERDNATLETYIVGNPIRR